MVMVIVSLFLVILLLFFVSISDYDDPPPAFDGLKIQQNPRLPAQVWDWSLRLSGFRPAIFR